MKFFEKHEIATTKIINQLWRSDYVYSSARNAAIDMVSPLIRPLKPKIERVLLVLGLLFITASILLFFAFNWAHIPPFVKMGAVLAIIGVLALINVYLLRQNKQFAANLVLSMNAFLVGVFMAVYGQIYQTGADAYTLFLTWAIMILPWVIFARFLPLWILWLVICTIAFATWWNLGIYSSTIDSSYIMIFIALFYLGIYFAMQFALKMGEQWLDKQWLKILLAICIFVPLTLYIIQFIFDIKLADLKIYDWLAPVLFIGFYAYIRWIKKAVNEFSVGFICLVTIAVSAIARIIFQNTSYEISYLLSGVITVAIFYYAYQYYKKTIAGFAGSKS
ncbi:MAG: DUF2157 domain-containing protein [Devosiaceae bacterium]|nr:DUF2157 domain-containing protein [Devosiaceae bacterium]